MKNGNVVGRKLLGWTSIFLFWALMSRTAYAEKTKAELLKLLSATEDVSKSFSIQWDQSTQHLINFPPLMKLPKNATLPASASAIFDGSRYKIQFDGTVFFHEEDDNEASGLETNNKTVRPIQQKKLSTFDGTTHKGLTITVDAANKWTPSGSIAEIQKNKSQILARDNFSIPLAFRPCNDLLRLCSLDDLEIQTDKPVINNRVCVVLAPEDLKGMKSRSGVIIVLDPALDYKCVRYILVVDGVKQPQTALQIDITYDKDVELGWVPNGWKIEQYQNNQVSQIITATNVKCKKLPPQEKSVFDITAYPAGTIIFDLIKDKLYRVNEDNSQVEISRSEIPLMKK